MKKKKRVFRTATERKRLLREIRAMRKEGMPLGRPLKMTKVKTSTFYKWMGEARG